MSIPAAPDRIAASEAAHRRSRASGRDARTDTTGLTTERQRAIVGMFAQVAANTERSAADLDQMYGPLRPDDLRDILVVDAHRYLCSELWDALNLGLRTHLSRRAA